MVKKFSTFSELERPSYFVDKNPLLGAPLFKIHKFKIIFLMLYSQLQSGAKARGTNNTAVTNGTAQEAAKCLF
jgi:hypothetical protein